MKQDKREDQKKDVPDKGGIDSKPPENEEASRCREAFALRVRDAGLAARASVAGVRNGPDMRNDDDDHARHQVADLSRITGPFRPNAAVCTTPQRTQRGPRNPLTPEGAAASLTVTDVAPRPYRHRSGPRPRDERERRGRRGLAAPEAKNRRSEPKASQTGGLLC